MTIKKEEDYTYCYIKYAYKKSKDKNEPELMGCAVVSQILDTLTRRRVIHVGFDIQNEIMNCPKLYKDQIWIDLWVEAKQIMLTHPDFYCPDPDFLGCLRAFKLLDEFEGDEEEYKHCLEKITQEKLETYEYKQSKWKDSKKDDEIEKIKEGINKYLTACVNIYEKLHKKIEEFHIDYNIKNWAYDTVFTHTDAFNRGKYCVTSGLILARNKGFPIHKEMARLISEKKEEIRFAIFENANKKMGF